MIALRNVRKSIRSQASRSASCRSRQRCETGSDRAIQAFRVQASAALTLYAQFAFSVLTGACSARTTPLS